VGGGLKPAPNLPLPVPRRLDSAPDLTPPAGPKPRISPRSARAHGERISPICQKAILGKHPLFHNPAARRRTLTVSSGASIHQRGQVTVTVDPPQPDLLERHQTLQQPKSRIFAYEARLCLRPSARPRESITSSNHWPGGYAKTSSTRIGTFHISFRVGKHNTHRDIPPADTRNRSRSRCRDQCLKLPCRGQLQHSQERLRAYRNRTD